MTEIERLRKHLEDLRQNHAEGYIWYLIDKRILEKRIEREESRLKNTRRGV